MNLKDESFGGNFRPPNDCASEGKIRQLMKLSAVIFDLNGTVVADEDEYGEAFSKVLRRLGVKVNSHYPHQGGIGVEENWRIFREKYNIKTDKTNSELAVETQQEYLKLIPRITLRDGFENLIEGLRSTGIKIALATSNTWNVVERLFDSLGIEKYFDSVTTGEEVGEKKPNPEIFEIASDKLVVSPNECLVIEDSSAGMEAAKFAGMKVIAIARDTLYKKELSKADLVVENLSEITPNAIYDLG